MSLQILQASKIGPLCDLSVRLTLGSWASSLAPAAFLAQPTDVLLVRTLAPFAPGA